MTTTLSVLIVDDEPPARRTLRALVEREPDAAVAGEAGDGERAVALIEAVRPDVVLLDVQMPRGSGFDVLTRIGDAVDCAVIFVTAYDRYALRAFEAQALDYLLKPFTDERFAEVFARARRAVRDRAAGRLESRLRAMADALPRAVLAGRLVVRDGARTLVLPFDEIEWVAAEDYYARIHTTRGRPLVRKPLRDLLRDLDAERFVRVHRSAIVNLDCVRSLRPLASGDAELTLASGAVVKVSRTCRADVEARLAHRPSSHPRA